MATGKSELNWQETPSAWTVGCTVQPPNNSTGTAGGKHMPPASCFERLAVGLGCGHHYLVTAAVPVLDPAADRRAAVPHVPCAGCGCAQRSRSASPHCSLSHPGSCVKPKPLLLNVSLYQRGMNKDVPPQNLSGWVRSWHFKAFLLLPDFAG